MTLLEIYQNLIKEKSHKFISENLNISISALKRWETNKKVPKQYEFEILKLAKIEINYSNYTSSAKDQFFTTPENAKKCFEIFKNTIEKFEEKFEDFTFIEPSAGAGVFLDLFPKERRIGLDVEKKHNDVIECDFFDYECKMKEKVVVFGNPPFGLRGHLALKFINKASVFADYVCFILPQLFESDGKGVPRKRVTNLNLIESVKISPNFTDPEGNIVKVNCVFQIWSKHHKNDIFDLNKKKNETMKIYSLSDGGTPSSTRNKKMINKCHTYLPSTCFGISNMKLYNTFNKLPNKRGYGIVFLKDIENNIEKFKKIDWTKIAFLSTNSAYNLRTSQIEKAFEN